MLQSPSFLGIHRKDGALVAQGGDKKVVEALPPTFLSPTPECVSSLRAEVRGEAISSSPFTVAEFLFNKYSDKGG